MKYILLLIFFNTTIVTFGQQSKIEKKIDRLISAKTTKPFNGIILISQKGRTKYGGLRLENVIWGGCIKMNSGMTLKTVKNFDDVRDLCSSLYVPKYKNCTVTETNIERFLGTIFLKNINKMVPKKRSEYFALFL